MEIERVARHIRREFLTARQALKDGNEGMARVCARRAAGAAITYWLQQQQRTGWGVDAMSQLRNLQQDPSIPKDVQNAAARLIAKITENSPFSTDPLNDSTLIIRHLMNIEPG